jgi:hypothetical protein
MRISPSTQIDATLQKPLEKRYGHPMFHTLIEEIRELHERKNRQYATSDDPLGNFRRTGKIIAKMLKPGLDPTLASCLAFMSKQVDGVYEIFGEEKTDTVDSLEDKLLDIAVYSIIAMILVRESREPARRRDMAGGFDPEAEVRCYVCNPGSTVMERRNYIRRLVRDLRSPLRRTGSGRRKEDADHPYTRLPVIASK